MPVFPINQLVALPGTLSGAKGRVKIEIPIKSFELLLEEEPTPVETALRMESMNLPSTDLAGLSGKSFRFPKNPGDGYIDGSIYIEHAHHPVDVTEITFGAISATAIEVKIDAVLDVEFEGLEDFENARWLFSTELSHG